jgi:hypothetical protein
MDDEQLSLEDAMKCPPGVPRDIWDDFNAQLDGEMEAWKASVEKHVRDYEKENPAAS